MLEGFTSHLELFWFGEICDVRRTTKKESKSFHVSRNWRTTDYPILGWDCGVNFSSILSKSKDQLRVTCHNSREKMCFVASLAYGTLILNLTMTSISSKCAMCVHYDAVSKKGKNFDVIHQTGVVKWLGGKNCLRLPALNWMLGDLQLAITIILNPLQQLRMH